MPSTAIGNADSPREAAVDARGAVTVAGRGWSLDWCVRSADRWHVPAREGGTAVAQRLVDAAPVVETSLRVPSGHAVHRAWCTRQCDDEWVVVEIENRSKQPVAAALVVRGRARLGVEETTVSVDRRVGVVLPRRPSRVVLDEDELLADGGEERWSGEARTSVAGFVFPLAHTARVRVAVPLDGASPAVDLDGLPDAERVARGWQAHAQPPGSLRLVVPDDAMAERIAAGRAALVVTHDAGPPDPAVLGALDRFGHHRLVRAALPALSLRDPASLRAVVDHWRLTGDAELAESVAYDVARAAHKLRADGGAADLLDAAGQPEAAARCRARARTGLPSPSHPLIEVRDGVVREVEPGPAVAVFTSYPPEWLGQGVEVHDAPTWWGRVSCAVRWHGARPALLWHVDAAVPVRLTAPGLDPSWSTTEARGEALLPPVEPPGGLPGVVAPLGRPGTDAGEAPEGGSFA